MKCPTHIQPRPMCYEAHWCPVDLKTKPHRKKSGGVSSGDLAGHVMDMLQLYAVPQVPGGTIYQQDGAPLHLANIVRTLLSEEFP